jgi:hypothetical protein
MYFCPECSYSYDIVKSSQISTIKDSRIPVDKVLAFKHFEANEDMSKYIATFTREDIIKNKKYQKIEDTQKNKFNLIFEQLVASGADFKCNKCNKIESIQETIILYSINLENNNSNIKTLEENEFICKDPILPRTHDYTCKNPNCITHKDKTLCEAVFIREKNSYKVNYICCVCYYSW